MATKRFHYYTQQATKILLEPVKVERWVKGGDVVEVEGIRFEVLDTPGFTRGSVSYLATIDGKRVAFTGDLIYGDGKIFDLYSFQDAIPEARVGGYHGYAARLGDLVSSLRKIKEAKPDVIYPARGPVIKNPQKAIDKLINRVQALYRNYLSTNALNWYFKEERMRICGERVLGKGAKIELMPYCLHVDTPEWILQFSTSRIISGYVGGLPGVHAMWSGSEWEWMKPIARNTELRTEAYLKDLIEHETRFAGRAVQQIYHVDFYDAKTGDQLAAADSWCFRTERNHAAEKGTKYTDVKNRQPRVYTQEELDSYTKYYEQEEIRGAETRYWDDVTVGDALPTMVKGPMTVTGFIAYAQGWGGLYIRANKMAWKLQQKHPGAGIKNRFGIPDCPERVHWEEEFALEVGAPGAYDYGPERASWLTHHVTNWAGDDGFLSQAKCQVRRHNPEGDIILIHGEVTRKFDKDGKYFVEISQRAEQQDGELSAVGSCIVELPKA